MKTALSITGVGLVFLLALIAAGPTNKIDIQQPAPQPEAYAEQMDALIAACSEKGAEQKSDFWENKDGEALSMMRGYFFSQNKDRLVSQMMAAFVNPTPQAVRHFADKRFFAVLHSYDPKMAKTYLAPWQKRPSALSRLQDNF